MRRSTSHFARRWVTPSSLAALLAGTLLAACGGGSGSGAAGAQPGTYRGTTAQGESLTLVVAPGGKALSSLLIQARYTCPAGETAVDGVPRGPGGQVPLNGGAFSGSFTAAGASYEVSGSFARGAFSGTLSASMPALSGSGTCTSGSVSWRAARAGAPAVDSTATARQQLAAAASSFNAGVEEFNSRSRSDAHAGNLNAFKADTTRLRSVLVQFDGAVRQISFRAASRARLRALLAADGEGLRRLAVLASSATAKQVAANYGAAVAAVAQVTTAEQALDASL